MKAGLDGEERTRTETDPVDNVAALAQVFERKPPGKPQKGQAGKGWVGRIRPQKALSRKQTAGNTDGREFEEGS